ncbi:sortase-associated OmpA-like protein PdsO [Shewanella oncorhynchi]|uniref:sortase-associated OmpA-like protein PdsO n=1 Tax=Shewanella oncorhynchi TaxID=2726434 RepID=UPI003D7A98BD
MMKKTLINLLVLSLLSAPVASVSARVSLQNQVIGQDLTLQNDAYASGIAMDDEYASEDEQPEALIGLGGGALVGALVGGPVGAIIGAFTGTLIGKSVSDTDTLHVQQRQIHLQESQLSEWSVKQQAAEKRASEYTKAQQELDELLSAQRQLLSELALGLSVQFRTGSSEVESHFLPQLDDVAEVMNLSPELNLELKGYADRRGDESYNQALSEQRLLEVRGYLIKQGVTAERMTTQAFGALSPLQADQDRESDVFDRRVTLTLQPHLALTARHAAD